MTFSMGVCPRPAAGGEGGPRWPRGLAGRCCRASSLLHRGPR